MWKQIVREAPALLGASDRTRLEAAAVLRCKLANGKITIQGVTALMAIMKELGFNSLDRPAKGDDQPSIFDMLRETKEG